MKKPLLALTVVLLIFAVSCGTEQPEVTPEYSFETDELDLTGYTCNIIQKYPVEEPFKYRQDTIGADLVLKRVTDIENKLHCDINFVQVTGSEYLDGLITTLIGGQYYGEIACSHQPSYLARSGVLYPLDVLSEYLDYMNADKFGSLGVLEQGMYNGVPYTVSPMQWLEKQATYSYDMFAFNTDLALKYAIVDPHEYVENGEWYWDKFEEFVANSTVNDGEISIKSVLIPWAFIDNVAFSNGFEYTMINESGNPITGTTSSNLSEAIDWVNKLYMTYPNNIYTSSGYDDAVNYFLSGQAFLYQTSFAHLIESIVYEMKNFGVVPFPCGPKGTYGKYYGPVSDIDSMGIWYNANEPEAAATIIDMLYEPLDGYETKDDLLSQANTIFFDERDADYYIKSLGSTRWNYWTTGMTDVWKSILNDAKTGKSSTEIIGKYEEKMNSIINEYIFGNAEFIEEWKEKH